MANTKKAKRLHNELMAKLPEYIDLLIDEHDFHKFKRLIDSDLNEKEKKEAENMRALLVVLEKSGRLSIGEYSDLLEALKKTNASLCHETHEISKLIKEIKACLEEPILSTDQCVAGLKEEEPLRKFEKGNKHNIKVLKDDNQFDKALPTVSNVQKEDLNEIKTTFKAHESHLQPSESEEKNLSVKDILKELDLTEEGKQICCEEEVTKMDLQKFWTLTGDELFGMNFKFNDIQTIMDYIEGNKARDGYCLQEEEYLISLCPFQEELAERALNQENTIIYSRTNSGKTYVAFYIILSHLRKSPNGKVLFTTQTNLLCEQQHKRATDLLKDKNVSIVKISSEEQITEFTMKNLMKSHNVFFMTPQLFVNNIRYKDDRKVSMEDFTLLVFDECHHCMSRSSSNSIMAHYRRKKYEFQETKLPQILGLTASPNIYRSKDKDSAVRYIKQLMANMDTLDISAVVQEKTDYDKYFDEPLRVDVETNSREDDEVQILPEEAIKKVENILKSEKVTNVLRDCKSDEHIWKDIKNSPVSKVSDHYDPWLQQIKKRIETLKTSSREIDRLLHTCIRHIEVYKAAIKLNNDLDYKDVKEMLGEKCEELEYESQDVEEKKLLKLMNDMAANIPNKVGTNPDLQRLIEILNTEYKDQKMQSRFLVFVSTRWIAKKLSQLLPEYLNCYYLTGSSTSEEKGGSTQDDQMDVLERFRIGTHKCLVATTIAHEGIDVSECNMTIHYKVNNSAISSLQMRGRIRTKDGKQFILGSGKQIRNETLNVERQELMDLAVRHILSAVKENKTKVKKELDDLQLNTMEKERLQIFEKCNETNKIQENFEVHCRKCKEMVCEGSDLRKLDCHNVVLDKEFISRTSSKPIKRKKKNFDDGLIKKYKIDGPCSHDVGVVMEYNRTDLPLLSYKSTY